MHAFECDSDDPLVLFSASNLPQQTRLGNQKADEPEALAGNRASCIATAKEIADEPQ
jgi:hypothetical protein